MSPKALRLIQSLSQIKNAINCLFANGHRRPALLNIFSLIDICSSISMDDSMGNAERYKAYLEKCMMPKSWDITLDELWSARCSVLHSYRADGWNTKEGTRPVYFYSSHEEKEQITREIEQRESRDFILMDLETVKWIAVDALNYLVINCDKDKDLMKNIEARVNTLLSDYPSYCIENFADFVNQMNPNQSLDTNGDSGGAPSP